MDNIIVWQKWLDPFGSDDIESAIEDNPEPYFIDEEDMATDLEDSHYNNKKKSQPIKTQPIKVIATPMGIIPITENTSSGKIFNFWMGHTNFNITNGVARIIEDTDGVETLDIFTRYRFRIGIGKVFKDAEVMKHINDNVYDHLG